MKTRIILLAVVPLVAPAYAQNHIDSAQLAGGKSPGCVATRLPEGNYDVTVTFADDKSAAAATVKAENRRLLLWHEQPAAKQTFTVNVRTPGIPGGGKVSLNKRELGPPLSKSWDGDLSLEILGDGVEVKSVDIAPNAAAPTVFLAGDSTVCDQPNEPWAGWGGMLPWFFKPGIAVANHAESGRALYSFRGEHRWDKILSQAKKGDFVLIQFGHNDQKDKSPGAGASTTYKDNLRQYVQAVREKGATPIIVTPMERRRWQGNQPQETLADYAAAAREVGKDENVPVVDLHAKSLALYRALGPENSKKAFVHYPAGTFPNQKDALKDDTHHNAYGAFELARCVASEVSNKAPDLAKWLRHDEKAFDPSKPDAPDAVNITPSAFTETEKPAGS